MRFFRENFSPRLVLVMFSYDLLLDLDLPFCMLLICVLLLWDATPPQTTAVPDLLMKSRAQHAL